MSTVRDLIRASMRKLGVLSSGETGSADEIEDGRMALNSMLDGWSTEKLLVYALTREEFSLAGSQQDYLIGPSGDFATPRPVSIQSAFVKQSNAELPVNILTIGDWNQISVKDVSGTFPTKLYYEPTSPSGKISVWPKPASTSTLVLYTLKPITSFSNVSDVVSFPTGYERAIIFNLAIELAPEYGRSAPAEVVTIATASKAAIKSINMQPEFLGVDQSLLSSGAIYNIMTGESR